MSVCVVYRSQKLSRLQLFASPWARIMLIMRRLPSYCGSDRQMHLAFVRQHPEIGQRAPEGITKASGKFTEKCICNWFRDITVLMKEENVFETLLDPNRVFNADGTNFRLFHEKCRALEETGSKDVYEIDQTDSKFSITIMFAFSVSTNSIEPMIICPFERIPAKVIHSVR